MWTQLLTIEVFSVPNDFLLALVTLVAAVVSALIVRVIYWRTRFGSGGAQHQAVAKRGFLALRVLAVVVLVWSSIILRRVDLETPREFWSREALNKGWWCAVRFIQTCLVTFAIFLFDTHPFLRIYVVLTSPLITALNMISEIDIANDVDCIEREVCTLQGSTLSELKFFLVRDLIEAGLTLVQLVLALWLVAYFGFRKNDIGFVRLEHREFQSSVSAQDEDDESGEQLL